VRYPGGAAVVCLLAAFFCKSPVTVSDAYCWWAFVFCGEEIKTKQ